MGIDGQSGHSSDGGRVGLVGLLLFFLVLLPKEAISGLVDGPCHMVLAPIKGKFSDFLPFLALPRLGWFLLPHLIFLLFLFVLRVLLVLFLRVLLVFTLITLASDGTELGIKFEQRWEKVRLLSLSSIFYFCP